MEDSSSENSPGFLRRVGAAVLRPRTAITYADEFARGQTGTDAMLLMGLLFLAVHTRRLIGGAWTVGAGDVLGGLFALASAFAQSIAIDLAILFGAGVLLSILLGGKRSPGRDFDMAFVAYVPVALVRLLSNLAQSLGLLDHSRVIEVLRWASYGWAAVLLVFAWQIGRKRGGTARPLQFRGALQCGLVLVLLAAVGALLQVRALSLDSLRPVVAGHTAPDFSLPTIAEDGSLGRPIRLSELRGKIVVLDFWATWCGPCRRAMPVLGAIGDEFRSRGVVVLSINNEGPSMAAAARRFVSDLGISVNLVSDTGSISSIYRATTIPHMVLVDERGIIRNIHRGFVSASRLERQLRDEIETLLLTK